MLQCSSTEEKMYPISAIQMTYFSFNHETKLEESLNKHVNNSKRTTNQENQTKKLIRYRN